LPIKKNNRIEIVALEKGNVIKMKRSLFQHQKKKITSITIDNQKFTQRTNEKCN